MWVQEGSAAEMDIPVGPWSGFATWFIYMGLVRMVKFT